MNAALNDPQEPSADQRSFQFSINNFEQNCNGEMEAPFIIISCSSKNPACFSAMIKSICLGYRSVFSFISGICFIVKSNERNPMPKPVQAGKGGRIGDSQKTGEGSDFCAGTEDGEPSRAKSDAWPLPHHAGGDR